RAPDPGEAAARRGRRSPSGGGAGAPRRPGARAGAGDGGAARGGRTAARGGRGAARGRRRRGILRRHGGRLRERPQRHGCRRAARLDAEGSEAAQAHQLRGGHLGALLRGPARGRVRLAQEDPVCLPGWLPRARSRAPPVEGSRPALARETVEDARGWRDPGRPRLPG
ncbi:unnamed protein product, partial [Prorocentrum cordatum]